LLSPQGETLLEQGMDVDLRETRRLRTIGKIVGFPLRGAGAYAIRVDRRPNEAAPWQEVAKVPLDVTIEAGLEEARANGEAVAAT
jgi:hypothetical protein